MNNFKKKPPVTGAGGRRYTKYRADFFAAVNPNDSLNGISRKILKNARKIRNADENIHHRREQIKINQSK
jgi:hypothetical protein